MIDRLKLFEQHLCNTLITVPIIVDRAETNKKPFLCRLNFRKKYIHVQHLIFTCCSSSSSFLFRCLTFPFLFFSSLSSSLDNTNNARKKGKQKIWLVQ